MRLSYYVEDRFFKDSLVLGELRCLEYAVRLAVEASRRSSSRHSLVVYKQKLFLGMSVKNEIMAAFRQGKLVHGYGTVEDLPSVDNILSNIKLERRSIAERECIHCNPEMIGRT